MAPDLPMHRERRLRYTLSAVGVVACCSILATFHTHAHICLFHTHIGGNLPNWMHLVMIHESRDHWSIIVGMLMKINFNYYLLLLFGTIFNLWSSNICINLTNIYRPFADINRFKFPFHWERKKCIHRKTANQTNATHRWWINIAFIRNHVTRPIYVCAK